MRIAMRRTPDMIEGIALFATFACLAHCIALPLAIALLPTLAAIVPVPTDFHVAALVLAVPSTLVALVLGYRHHRGTRPLAMGIFGLALLVLAVALWGETVLEAPVTIFGSIAIAAAHLGNWQMRRRAAPTHPDIAVALVR